MPLSAKTMARVRDYAVEEPSFTVAFAAWELRLSVATVQLAIKPLIKNNVIRVIEEANGPYGATYQYVPPDKNAKYTRRFAGADEMTPVADLAERRAKQVPYTRAKGASGRPGRDKKHQAKGGKVKRRRAGT